MEPKKTEKADLTNKSWFFFNIGLLVTMVIVVMAFEYKKYDDASAVDLARNQNAFEEMIDVPLTEQPPPPPPKAPQPQIVEVEEEEIKEEIKIDFDVEVTENTVVEEIEIAPIEEPKEDVNQIFQIVEEPADFKGGMNAFYKFVQSNLKYPSQARRMNVQGRVYVQFVIERDGTLTDIQVMKGIGAGCDEEAIRVVKMSPPWNPGKQRGKAVRERRVLPIYFQLN